MPKKTNMSFARAIMDRMESASRSQAIYVREDTTGFAPASQDLRDAGSSIVDKFAQAYSNLKGVFGDYKDKIVDDLVTMDWKETDGDTEISYNFKNSEDFKDVADVKLTASFRKNDDNGYNFSVKADGGTGLEKTGLDKIAKIYDSVEFNDIDQFIGQFNDDLLKVFFTYVTNAMDLS